MKNRGVNIPKLIVFILLIVGIAGFIYYYRQTSTLRNQMSSASAQISSLQNQLSSADSQIQSLRSQNADLQGIVDLSKSQTLAASKTINQDAGGLSPVATYQANHAGYIIVSGTSTTTNGYIMVRQSFSNYPFNTYRYSFGTSGNLLVPILPGTITISFGNTNFLNGATATLTVVYYY